MRLELKAIQRRVGITALFVTHDQEEALSMADRLAVMNHGRIEQVGTPVEIYERPRTLFVAGFIGQSNFFAGRIVDPGTGDGAAVLENAEGRRLHAGNPLGLAGGSQAVLSVKDQRTRLSPSPAPGHAFAATVESVAYLGTAIQYVCRSNGQAVMALVSNDGQSAVLSPETNVWIDWQPRDAVLLPET